MRTKYKPFLRSIVQSDLFIINKLNLGHPWYEWHRGDCTRKEFCTKGPNRFSNIQPRLNYCPREGRR
jgi:hypothetical protein